jgi:hypothetical protein
MSGLKENCPQFQYHIAELCSTKWFDVEFNKYNLNNKIIISLGRDVENFFKSWSNSYDLKNSNKIIRLPHPSGRCRSYNKNFKQTEHIADAISRLLNLI